VNHVGFITGSPMRLQRPRHRVAGIIAGATTTCSRWAWRRRAGHRRQGADLRRLPFRRSSFRAWTGSRRTRSSRPSNMSLSSLIASALNGGAELGGVGLFRDRGGSGNPSFNNAPTSRLPPASAGSRAATGSTGRMTAAATDATSKPPSAATDRAWTSGRQRRGPHRG
jgi:hypothetical protein